MLCRINTSLTYILYYVYCHILLCQRILYFVWYALYVCVVWCVQRVSETLTWKDSLEKILKQSQNEKPKKKQKGVPPHTHRLHAYISEGIPHLRLFMRTHNSTVLFVSCVFYFLFVFVCIALFWLSPWVCCCFLCIDDIKHMVSDKQAHVLWIFCIANHQRVPIWVCRSEIFHLSQHTNTHTHTRTH